MLQIACQKTRKMKKKIAKTTRSQVLEEFEDSLRILKS
jgi:hypothetical protein